MRSPVILFLLIPALGALAVAEPPANANRADWYAGPQLFVMTGYIANSTSGTWGLDFIGKGEWSREQQLADLAEWNKGLGRDYDPDSTIKAFKDAGATGMIFYDKWHDGLVPHKTKYTNYMTERDLVGDTLKALRKHDMKIVVYYSVGLDANPEAKFKDWVCRDAAGKPMGLCFPGDWRSFHSPYRQYVINHLIEIMNKYGPFQGFYLDLYTQPIPLSRDKYTAKAFQKAYGKPVEQATEAEATEFNIKTLEEYLQEIRKAITAVRPEIQFTFNGAGRADATLPKRARLVDDQADWLSIEGHRRDRIDSIATVGQGWNRPFETGILLNTSWYVPMSDEAPRASMSKEEAIVSAGSVFIRGGNVFAAMTPGHSGVYSGKEDLALLRAVGDWLKGNKRYIQGSEPVAEIGIFRGDPSDELVRVPPVGEIWDRTYPTSDRRQYERTAGAVPGTETDLTLRGLGYLTQLTGSAFARQPFDPKAYRLVVLPE
ncbi:MAG: alpha-L-fucosidase, partial [bacterium]|nr:alpha-L-fucosidase [bacterium]